MKKIQESFREIVAGEPRKEHYINFSIVVTLIAVVVGVVLVVVGK